MGDTFFDHEIPPEAGLRIPKNEKRLELVFSV